MDTNIKAFEECNTEEELFNNLDLLKEILWQKYIDNAKKWLEDLNKCKFYLTEEEKKELLSSI